jgi:hypothetical protein
MFSFGMATLGVLGFSALAEVWGAPLSVGMGGVTLLVVALLSVLRPCLRNIR